MKTLCMKLVSFTMDRKVINLNLKPLCKQLQLSDSARARRAHKQELLQTIGEQAASERARREAEKAYARQGV